MQWILRLCFLVVMAAPAAAQTLVIEDVAIIDVEDGQVRPRSTVVIEGNRIVALDQPSTVPVPNEAVRIDGSGKFLIPGLWDMHVHTSTDTITRDIIYPLFVAHGITGIRNMHADCMEPCSPIQSRMEHVAIHRKEIKAGTLVGPRIVASSAFANGERTPGLGTGTPEDARRFVQVAKLRGVDFIKVYDQIPRESYWALIDEAKSSGMPFAGHVPVALRMSETSRAGQASIEHLGAGNALEQCSSREDQMRSRLLDEFAEPEPWLLPLVLEMVASFDAGKCDELSAVLAANRTWIVPTLLATDPIRSGEPEWQESAYRRFLPPAERRFWEEDVPAYEAMMGSDAQRRPYTDFVYALAKRFHEAGVPILAGSDAGASRVYWGISLHQELERLVAVGMAPAEALRSATISPAQFLGRESTAGSVEVGKVADLVLLGGNPLDDIRNTRKIDAVILNGRLLDRTELHGLLSKAEVAASISE